MREISEINKVEEISDFLELIKRDILASECLVQQGVVNFPSELVEEITNLPNRIKYEVLEDGSMMRMFGLGNSKVIGYTANYGGHYVVESAGESGDSNKYKYVKPVTLIRCNYDDLIEGDFIIKFPELNLESIDSFLHTDEFILVMSDDKFVVVQNDSVFEYDGLINLVINSKHVFKVVVK